jgi:hypothetical protein
MEILINELSLSGQFTDASQFIEVGLSPVTRVLKELDTSKDVLLKKEDFWRSQVTSIHNIHDILIQKSDETTRFKSVLSRLIDEPFWENSQKHNDVDTYKYNKKDVIKTSLAESCERDKIVVSFLHTDFSNQKLQVLKNENYVDIDNLFQKEYYIEVAYSKNQITKCEYFERKFKLGLIVLLENECEFILTHEIRQGQRVYRRITTNDYWYLDNLHKNHYEVFDSNRKHVGEADLQGNIDISKRINGRTL